MTERSEETRETLAGDGEGNPGPIAGPMSGPILFGVDWAGSMRPIVSGDRRGGKLAGLALAIAVVSDEHRRRRQERERRERMIEEAAERVALAAGGVAADVAVTLRSLVEAFESQGYPVAGIRTCGAVVQAILGVGPGLGSALEPVSDAFTLVAAKSCATEPCALGRRKLTRGHEVNPYATGRRRVRGGDPVRGVARSQTGVAMIRNGRWHAIGGRGRR